MKMLAYQAHQRVWAQLSLGLVQAGILLNCPRLYSMLQPRIVVQCVSEFE